MNNFWKRTISGIVYVALIVFTVFANHWITALILAALAALTTYEFHKNTNKLENVNVNPIIPAIASIAPLGYLVLLTVKNYYNIAFIFAGLYFVFGLYIFIAEIFKQKTNPISNIAYTFLGQIYIALPFLLMYGIKEINEIFLFALFVLIWANDTFAYLAGSTFGKHRMCERISPKKSWEGFVGGLLGALIVAFVFSRFETQLDVIQWLGFALIVVVFGTLGDLFESLMKRTIGVKDSGNIMPGHGGLLDRFDSLLFATPVIFVYLILFEL
ncbi:MAG: phosphatidate cytidylyltransferase [Prevotellaceae bacterium]|jgi:phosphatidate cytidylyltransferase|nr:phosphatidate cytidylyltransferase [Prevotellaceae bacterium]